MRLLPSVPVVLIRDYMTDLMIHQSTKHPFSLTVVATSLRRSGISALFGL